MSRILLVHGFNVRDKGARTVDRLSPFFRGMGHTVDTDAADYGWHGLLKVRFFPGSAVKRIADAIMHCDAVVTHSNGANYFEQAAQLVNKPVTVFHISPALDKDFAISNQNSTYVFHTNHDRAVWWSKWLLRHPWGEMGRVGSTQPGVRNYDFTYRVRGHSDWFKGLNPRFFATWINKILRRQHESN